MFVIISVNLKWDMNMALIGSNSVTDRFNSAAINLDGLMHLNKKFTLADVTTKSVLSLFAEMNQSKTGWGYSLKKMIVPSAVYSTVLSLPIAGIGGASWYFGRALRNVQSVSDLIPFATWGAGISGLLTVDFAVGKIFGIRPITNILIIAYDVYREAAANLSNQVKDAYIGYEQEMKGSILDKKRDMKNRLTEVYMKMAQVLIDSPGISKPELKKFKQETLPAIGKQLSKLSLTRAEVESILEPLEFVIDQKMKEGAIPLSKEVQKASLFAAFFSNPFLTF